MARSNMDKKKADEEIRKKEVQLQELSAKYQSLQSSHKKIRDMKDELEQIYSSKFLKLVQNFWIKSTHVIRFTYIPYNIS